MTRTLLLGAALAFGLATAANAGIAPAPVGKTESLMSKVAEDAVAASGGARTAGAIRCSTAGRARPATIWARSASAAGPTSKGPKTSIERGGRANGFGRFHFMDAPRGAY